MVAAVADPRPASDSQGSIYPCPSPACLRRKRACAQAVSLVLRAEGALRMGVTPIRDHGEDSRCGALQPILSLLAGAERGSELV